MSSPLSSWRRDVPPPAAQLLIRREPGLARAVLGWRQADRLEIVTVDVRGRYWLWREEVTFWETPELVPVFGPVSRLTRRGDAFETDVRASIEALLKQPEEMAA